MSYGHRIWEDQRLFERLSFIIMNQYADLDNCPKCGVSRYKNTLSSGMKKGVSLKLLWYIPIIPRFKCIFSNVNTAKLLRWHDKVREWDGLYRPPTDATQRKNINSQFPTFGMNVWNLRLGLSTNGMNMCGMLRTTYNIWPVLLTIYNLPLWLNMKWK